MSDTILITYATQTGSTAGVAECIGETLAGHGLTVDVKLMADVTDLNSYRAVVAGSAIQSKQWLPEAMQFVQQHQGALNQRPFAAFLVCMTMAMEGDWREQVSEWLDPVRALVPTVSDGLFAGILNISEIPYRGARWGFRISVMTGVWKEGDHRDWDAIRAWAGDLGGKLCDP